MRTAAFCHSMIQIRTTNTSASWPDNEESRKMSLLLSFSLGNTGLKCYGNVKNGFDSAILTKIPRMKKKKGLGRPQMTKM